MYVSMCMHYCVGHTEAVIAVSFSPEGRCVHVYLNVYDLIYKIDQNVTAYDNITTLQWQNGHRWPSLLSQTAFC